MKVYNAGWKDFDKAHAGCVCDIHLNLNDHNTVDNDIESLALLYLIQILTLVF